jgi:Cys-rich protein (TIGR01571 family)
MLPAALQGCMDDCGTCCYGCWCPCCLFGDNAEKLGDGGCCLNCCLYYLLAAFCCNSCFAAPKRGRLRANHNLGEEPCGDCCTHFWCTTCAICQEARFIKVRPACCSR